jgi:hypothetical protein
MVIKCVGKWRLFSEFEQVPGKVGDTVVLRVRL